MTETQNAMIRDIYTRPTNPQSRYGEHSVADSWRLATPPVGRCAAVVTAWVDTVAAVPWVGTFVASTAPWVGTLAAVPWVGRLATVVVSWFNTFAAAAAPQVGIFSAVDIFAWGRLL